MYFVRNPRPNTDINWTTDKACQTHDWRERFHWYTTTHTYYCHMVDYHHCCIVLSRMFNTTLFVVDCFRPCSLAARPLDQAGVAAAQIQQINRYVRFWFFLFLVLFSTLTRERSIWQKTPLQLPPQGAIPSELHALEQLKRLTVTFNKFKGLTVNVFRLCVAADSMRCLGVDLGIFKAGLVGHVQI